MPSELETFFYPKTVAIVGASRSPEKLGSIILKNIVDSGYDGKIYPVNPHTDSINDLKVYKEISQLPEIPELAIVSIPAAFVNEIVAQLGEFGVKNVVVLTAGFKEIGSEGATLEKDLVLLAEKYKLNLLGPNCLGFINNLAPINATFAEKVRETGNLRFISQSGAIAASLFDYCNSTGLGISEFVTLGNKAGLTENDILKHFHAEKQPSINSEGLSSLNPIGLYLESISHGPEFLKLIQEITKKDPILILKPGKTQAAAKAMQSHTGSIAGEDAVLDEVLKQAGAVRCYTLEEFFDFSRAFAWENLPQGPRVAVISNAGGPAVISADAIVGAGLEFAQFDEKTKEKLISVLPRSASIINPVDVLGDALADRFSEAIEIVLQNEQVDSLIVLLTPQLMTQTEKTAEIIGMLSKKHNKPVFCSFIGGHAVLKGTTVLDKYKIPSFEFPERAINALAAMWKFKQRLLEANEPTNTSEKMLLQPEMGTIRNVLQHAINEEQQSLDNTAVDSILVSVGIKTPPTRIVKTLEEAKQFAAQIGLPVVMKLSSPGLLHKKNVGGVVVDISNEALLEEAWQKLERNVEQLDVNIKKQVSFQMQKNILGGVEVIIGVKTDPTFGPLLLFGAGGSYAELIQDRNINLLPLEIPQAKKIVERSKIYSILKGHEGDLPYALDKLYDVIVRVSKLAELIPDATDIEINPVIVTMNNVWSVDGKIVLKEIKHKPMPPQLKEAICTMNKVLSSKFHYLELETSEPFEFKAGQYISVKVASAAIRAYSIATHERNNKLYLLVDTRPGGPGSQFFENLNVGDKVPFLGPFGLFTMKLDDGAESYLFLGTGSGLSALRCMIDFALKEQNITKPIALYTGFTHETEIFWKDHFEELAKQYPNFTYKLAIFEPSEAWTGHKGYNTDFIKESFSETSKVAAYLCGHPAMIAGAKNILLETGCPEERIYTERFL